MANTAFNATVFALEYGIPFLQFAGSVTRLLVNGSTNVFYTSGTLATPSSPILAPNDDTIYSEAVYDLSQNDLIITFPEVDADRYFNVGFFDPYFGVFANLGTVTQTEPGNYLMRLPHGHRVPYGPTHTTRHEYKGEVVSPTTFGTLLVRALLKNNGSDLTYVQGVLNQTKLSKLPRPSTRKPLSLADFAGVSANETAVTIKTLEQLPTLEVAKAVINLTTILAAENPPWNVTSAEAKMVNKQLELAGIHDGTYIPPPGVNLTLAADALFTAALAIFKTAIIPLNNGWSRPILQGIYGSNFLVRATTAVEAIGEQTIDQALYAVNQDMDPILVTSNDSYLFTFSTKPPILATGFWSLTLYLQNEHFFANPLDQYSLGDRSHLTYPEGSLVYGGAKSNTTDAPFQILIQDVAIPPPANWTSNWLPAPSVTSNVTLTLRLYAPTESMINGTWEYPILTRISPIKS